MEKVRVRFAPSPTGSLHIGGARTALFNWLFAHNRQGVLVLRLEDTDLQRSTDDAAAGIIDGLKWLGLDWDEGPGVGGDYGPYRQSERLAIYRRYIEQLLDQNKAYYCFCSPDELKQQRERAQADKRNYLYEGRCLQMTAAEVNARLAAGERPVVRLKVNRAGHTVVNDLIRGAVQFDDQLMDDFIIAKSDGWPTYNFAVVVDDHAMDISHVIRAEEHLPNTPKQIKVYEALGWDLPHFAHVSMILAPDRSKLSKRHGATSVQEFRDEGYLPEALVNYLVLLGWSPGEDIDIYPLEQMVKNFSLEAVSRSAAIYDLAKLTWMNGVYLAAADPDRVADLVAPEAIQKGWLSEDNRHYFRRVVDLVRSRAKTTPEILSLAGYFFAAPDTYDVKGTQKYFRPADSAIHIRAVLEVIKATGEFTASSLEEGIRDKAAQMGVKASTLIHPTRLGLTGVTNTPGLFEVMELLGRDACQARLERALLYIGELPAD
ncbi:MAG: glutamate--tRNA ligase [Syntrophomonadaceae bacterium]